MSGIVVQAACLVELVRLRVALPGRLIVPHKSWIGGGIASSGGVNGEVDAGGRGAND